MLIIKIKSVTDEQNILYMKLREKKIIKKYIYIHILK